MNASDAMPVAAVSYFLFLRPLPFGPEPFGNQLKAELLMAEGRSLR